MLSLIIVSCLSMVIKDLVGVFGVAAEAKGNERLAGALNPLGTIASIIFYSVGALGLVHGHGAWGYVCLIPVLIVDYIDGRFFTAVSRYIQSDESNNNAGLTEIVRGFKVVGAQWLHAALRWTHLAS
jgi:hypothetical protein